MGLWKRARFIVADAAATGLPSGQMDGAMSIDALQLMPDRHAVLAEVRRILRPTARFALTTWEPTESEQGALDNPNKKPLRTSLEGAGFNVTRYETTPAWRRIGKALFEGWLKEKEALVAEMGAEAYAPLEREATKSLPFLEKDERVLIVSVAV